MLKEQPKDTLHELKQTHSSLLEIIEQNHTWAKNTQEVLNLATEALQTEVELLKRLYDASHNEVVFVPDTNALLYNPDLESWEFPDTKKFLIVLL